METGVKIRDLVLFLFRKEVLYRRWSSLLVFKHGNVLRGHTLRAGQELHFYLFFTTGLGRHAMPYATHKNDQKIRSRSLSKFACRLIGNRRECWSNNYVSGTVL